MFLKREDSESDQSRTMVVDASCQSKEKGFDEVKWTEEPSRVVHAIDSNRGN